MPSSLATDRWVTALLLWITFSNFRIINVSSVAVSDIVRDCFCKVVLYTFMEWILHRSLRERQWLILVMEAADTEIRGNLK